MQVKKRPKIIFFDVGVATLHLHAIPFSTSSVSAVVERKVDAHGDESSIPVAVSFSN